MNWVIGKKQKRRNRIKAQFGKNPMELEAWESLQYVASSVFFNMFNSLKRCELSTCSGFSDPRFPEPLRIPSVRA
jgi:hypothetical protein